MGMPESPILNQGRSRISSQASKKMRGRRKSQLDMPNIITEKFIRHKKVFPCAFLLARV
jgi:hypothetical protein